MYNVRAIHRGHRGITGFVSIPRQSFNFLLFKLRFTFIHSCFRHSSAVFLLLNRTSNHSVRQTFFEINPVILKIFALHEINNLLFKNNRQSKDCFVGLCDMMDLRLLPATSITGKNYFQYLWK